MLRFVLTVSVAEVPWSGLVAERAWWGPAAVGFSVGVGWGVAVLEPVVLAQAVVRLVVKGAAEDD
ncbi:hypothetical protein [Phytohabitans kaempferiae]|uniref:Uncharacterized protein n=1 Tax=Phytohabitans kaempferiae TaxID=1620943 RepID=A0ABV6MGQ8_9ACTN